MRQIILELGSEAFRHRRTPNDLLHIRFLRAARRHCTRPASPTRRARIFAIGRPSWAASPSPTGSSAIVRADKMIGVMLPASVAGVLVNLAALFAARSPSTSNFTAGAEATDAALSQCGISNHRHLPPLRRESPS